MFSVKSFASNPILQLIILKISLGQNFGISKILKFLPDCFLPEGYICIYK